MQQGLVGAKAASRELASVFRMCCQEGVEVGIECLSVGVLSGVADISVIKSQALCARTDGERVIAISYKL